MTAYKLLRTSSHFFAFLALFLFHIPTHAQTLGNSCSNYSSTNTLNQYYRCSDIQGGYLNLSRTFQHRLDYLGTQANWKMKFRSLIVGAKHNGRSSFGLGSKQKSPGSPSTFHFNSWWNSVFLGCDVDGNCIYERENDFLDWVVANRFDEIILTGVEDILQYGSKNAESIGATSGRSFPNSMREIQRFDWHLARFIYKAKSEYGIRGSCHIE